MMDDENVGQAVEALEKRLGRDRTLKFLEAIASAKELDERSDEE